MVCCKCKSDKALIKYAGYSRMNVRIEGECLKLETVYVPRMYCKTCKRTFAVLKDDEIKNTSYCESFKKEVVNQYRSRADTVEKICMKYQIAITTMYKWVHQMEKEEKSS
ncbi:hypothetical protein P261_00133 [Lachnospiraceae bacterium TWA4]|nr:hypothetical protein P261_00133 [Lachnospiraceae bacterium TWA4]